MGCLHRKATIKKCGRLSDMQTDKHNGEGISVSVCLCRQYKKCVFTPLNPKFTIHISQNVMQFNGRKRSMWQCNLIALKSLSRGVLILLCTLSGRYNQTEPLPWDYLPLQTPPHIANCQLSYSCHNLTAMSLFMLHHSFTNELVGNMSYVSHNIHKWKKAAF